MVRENSYVHGTSLDDAVTWVLAALTGQAAMTCAALAIASIGLFMLGGRLPARRGVTVLLGCSILFSARMIADGLLSASIGLRKEVAASSSERAYAAPVLRAEARDPYAGAAVPVQR